MGLSLKSANHFRACFSSSQLICLLWVLAVAFGFLGCPLKTTLKSPFSYDICSELTRPGGKFRVTSQIARHGGCVSFLLDRSGYVSEMGDALLASNRVRSFTLFPTILEVNRVQLHSRARNKNRSRTKHGFRLSPGSAAKTKLRLLRVHGTAIQG